MYTKNKDNKFTLRLSDKQLAHIDMLADSFNLSRSDIIRILIDKDIAYYIKKGGATK